jgi:hypothetical protein
VTFRRLALAISVALVGIAACASTKVTQQTGRTSLELARPPRIWVHDFIADPSDVPADSAIRSQLTAPATPLSAKELETGRRLGALIAKHLIDDLDKMGFAARRPELRSPAVGDGVIRGYLISVRGGSAIKRFTVGLGAGGSELDTVVEGYVQTEQGLRRLGSGTLSSSGSKTPGAAAPAAVALASANPVGLIVVGGTKVYGEMSGKSTLEGRAKATADEISKQLRLRFQDRGWLK